MVVFSAATVVDDQLVNPSRRYIDHAYEHPHQAGRGKQQSGDMI